MSRMIDIRDTKRFAAPKALSRIEVQYCTSSSGTPAFSVRVKGRMGIILQVSIDSGMLVRGKYYCV